MHSQSHVFSIIQVEVLMLKYLRAINDDRQYSQPVIYSKSLGKMPEFYSDDFVSLQSSVMD